MSQRQRLPHRPRPWNARSAPPPLAALRGHTVPLPPVPAPDDDESAILGFPAEYDTGAQQLAARLPDVPHPAGATAAGAHLLVVPRREWLGGVLLVLAGGAADVSLWLRWWRGGPATGLSLVREGLTVLGSGVGAAGRSGLWQPLVVVLGGGVLLLVGLLLFRRARSHRPAGVLALVATLAAATGVVVPLADANWSAAAFGPGMWVATAVAGLGALGSLKAMLTAPAVTAEPG